jgi:hypothetical protein
MDGPPPKIHWTPERGFHEIQPKKRVRWIGPFKTNIAGHEVEPGEIVEVPAHLGTDSPWFESLD